MKPDTRTECAHCGDEVIYDYVLHRWTHVGRGWNCYPHQPQPRAWPAGGHGDTPEEPCDAVDAV